MYVCDSTKWPSNVIQMPWQNMKLKTKEQHFKITPNTENRNDSPKRTGGFSCFKCTIAANIIKWYSFFYHYHLQFYFIFDRNQMRCREFTLISCCCLLLLLSNLPELPPLGLYGIAERTFTQLYSLLGCSSHRVMQYLNATRNMRVCNQVLSPYSFWSASLCVCAFILFFSSVLWVYLCSCQYFLCSVVTIFDLVHLFSLNYIIK